MLSSMSGSSPVLLALTGEQYAGRGFFKKVGRGIRKAAGVGKWLIPGAAPALVALKAAQATRDALKRKRAKNIERAKIQRADRARKLAEARRRQAIAEREAAAEQSRTAVEQSRTASTPPPAAPQYDEPSQYEVVDQTADTPAEETEEIQDTSEEGAEEGAEVMGYARSNDDYFVGASALKKAVRTKGSTSGQIKIVPKSGLSKKTLYILGGAIVAGYIFRKQLKKALRG